MPLLRQAPLIKRKVPKNLNNWDKLYYLELTDEVFTEYEEYCYRTIQCNSLVWTCEETGRTELTYAEALESEKTAKEILATFPHSLKVPALYLASIAQSTSFQEVVSDVYGFMKDHYFINEIVIPRTKEKWKRGKIVSVKNPTKENEKSDKKSSQKGPKYTPPGWYLYDVDLNYQGKPDIHQICGAKLKRCDDLFLTKDALSAFIKYNAVLDSRGIWVIKGAVLRKFQIQLVKFSDIFIGDPPVFTRIVDKKIGSQFKAGGSLASGSCPKTASEVKKSAGNKSRGRSITPNKEIRARTKSLTPNCEQNIRSDSSSKSSSKQKSGSITHKKKQKNEAISSSSEIDEHKGRSVSPLQRQRQQSVTPGKKQKEQSISPKHENRKQRAQSATPKKKPRKRSVSRTPMKRENADELSQSETSSKRRKEWSSTSKRVATKQKSSSSKLVQQSGQQIIDRYFISSKKSPGAMSDAVKLENENQESDSEANNKCGNKLYDSEVESVFGSKKYESEADSTCGSKRYDSEAESVFGTQKLDSDRESIFGSLESNTPGSSSVIWSHSVRPHHKPSSEEENEEISSDEDLKVVWSSTVKPNELVIKEICKKFGPQAAEKLRTGYESGNESDRSWKSDMSQQSAVLSNGEEIENVLEGASDSSKNYDREFNRQKLGQEIKKPHKSPTSKDKETKDKSLKRPQKKYSSVEERKSLDKQINSPKQKLKQTSMFAGQHSNETGSFTKDKKRKKSVSSSSKKVYKKYAGLGRKQKVVGTLMPWVKATKKEIGETLSKGTVGKASENSESNHKEKKKNWLERQRQIELEEKMKKQEERRQLKAKQEEEKQKFANFMKEWRKHREDLLCEDLKPLPLPCDIDCRIRNELFGDFIMILEFFHAFNTVLRVKSCLPGGLTFEYLERALVESEIAGPLNDIIHVLLLGIFDFQIAEPYSGVPITVDLNLDAPCDEDITPEEANPQCVAATGWSNVFQGVSLHDIPINHATITEVLRLHLLGSGGRARDFTSKCLRGGFTNLEDPGLWLRMEKPSILKNLGRHHVCELSADEKLTILSCLVDQVLTYASIRDKLDVRGEQMRKAKADYRSLQIAELKLQKEAASQRYQAKKEAKLQKLSVQQGSSSHSSTISQEEIDLKKQKLEKQINKIQADLQKKGSKILPLTMSHQLLPIGCDRAHRRYWLFSSLPGLFVENSPFEVGPCLPQPTPQASELDDTLTHVRRLFEEESQNANSDKENDTCDKDVSKPQTVCTKKMLIEQNKSVDTHCDEKGSEKADQNVEAQDTNERESLICTASEKCPVHGSSTRKSHWSFFPKKEDINILLECLNERGIRESALRRIILQEEQRIIESVSECPVHKLNPEKFADADREQRKSSRNSSSYTPESARLNYPPNVTVSYIMEWSMREFILELENKIVSGNVGSLKVNDRLAWRTAIELGKYDKQCDRLQWGFKKSYSLHQDATLINIDGVKCIKKLQDGDDDEEEMNMKKHAEEEDMKNTEAEEEEKRRDVENEETIEDDKECVEDDRDIINKYRSLDEELIEETETSQEHKKLEEQEKALNEEMEYKQEVNQEPYAKEIIRHAEKSEKSETCEEKCGDITIQPAEESEKDGTDVESRIGKVSQETAESENGMRTVENKKDADTNSDDGNITEEKSERETSAGDEWESLPESQYQNTDRSDTDLENDDRCESVCSVNESHNSPESEPTDTDSEETSKSDSVPSPRNPVVKELACAILQLGQSVDPKYLKKPLAYDHSSRETRMKSWEISLMKTVNFSQLFLHHSTLESSINWSISALNTPCSICRRRGNAHKMLLCDGCNRGHHMYCLKPKLKAIPKDDWFCPNCVPVQRRSSRNCDTSNVLENNDNISNLSTIRTTSDGKRKTVSGGKNDEDDILVEHVSKVRKVSDDELCGKCAQKGALMFCTTCSIGFHHECINLPTRSLRRQIENWQCESCKIKEQSSKSDVAEEHNLEDSSGSDDENYDGVPEEPRVYSSNIFERSEMINRERRGCTSASIAKIATFTKRLRTNSWDDDGEESQRAYLVENNSDEINFQDYLVRKSSRRCRFASDDLPLDNAVLQDLLKEMLRHEDAWPFRKPVRKCEAPDYHSIIKKPMDLGMVKYKLNTAEYKNNGEFTADVLSVFKNCFMYNSNDAPEFKCATRLLNFFERRRYELGLVREN